MAFWRQSLRLTNRILTQPRSQIMLRDSRDIKRWVAPTMRELARRRKEIGPEPERPRSSFLEWNYNMEVRCFGKRVGENIDEKLLKEAFIQQEWANLLEFNAKKSGDESFVPLQHNLELAQDGYEILCKCIKEVYVKSYPTDVVNAVCDYLTTDKMLAHVAFHLGVKDIVKSAEFPPETKTLADAFKAVVGALSLSTDVARVKLFVNDFVISQMKGKDIYDVWTPDKPYDYLVRLLHENGIDELEPRLCNKSAANTILANYQVGLYNPKDKSCLGLGWGESIQLAKDTAALDAVQRILNSYSSK